MCTFNGADFIDQQLESIAKQTHAQWRLFVSDDGSTDDTLLRVEQFARRFPAGQVIVFAGPEKGFAKNFISLLGREQLDCPYIAFADQDDLWLPGKLSQAINILQAIDPQTPALYGGRTIYMDGQDKLLGESALFTQPPSFANALVQCIAGGNTMMLNRRALELVQLASERADIVSHDWWMYLVVTALGGQVHYDPVPMVLYRQHQGNVVGMNTSLMQKFHRIVWLLAGKFRDWNARNIAALLPLRPSMSAAAQECFDAFRAARVQGLRLRLRNMRKAGVYRQTLLGNLGLWFAIVTGRI
jgi:glycosyltransferase involved in cell wall biosynthesis